MLLQFLYNQNNVSCNVFVNILASDYIRAVVIYWLFFFSRNSDTSCTLIVALHSKRHLQQKTQID